MGKFVIHSEAAENRFPAIPKYIMTRSEACIACGRCITRCIYGAHFRSEADHRKMADPDSTKCRHCLVCIQDCPVKALSISFNEEFLKMGTPLFQPDIINCCMKEGETGKNPVSGGGFGGAFSGEGFDSFWTDMSEIVRPTRDGIHAREYISTSLEIGRKPRDVNFLKFDEYGHPLVNIPPMIEINLPILFDLTGFPMKAGAIDLAFAITASDLRTLAIIEKERLSGLLTPYSNNLIESVNPERVPWGELVELAQSRVIIELPYSPTLADLPRSLKKVNSDLIVMVKIEEPTEVEQTVLEIYQRGADIIHLRSIEKLPDLVRRAHLALVKESLRDEITLIASGGLAEAVHVPKIIILGADAVALSEPLFFALECTLCGTCRALETCPRKLDAIEPSWGKSRIKNLMASWHNQMLEILGAMGMREVSRLRGEVGRAIFFEDLDKELRRDLGEAHIKEPL
jgi:ferredoxin